MAKYGSAYMCMRNASNRDRRIERVCVSAHVCICVCVYECVRVCVCAFEGHPSMELFSQSTIPIPYVQRRLVSFPVAESGRSSSIIFPRATTMSLGCMKIRRMRKWKNGLGRGEANEEDRMEAQITCCFVPLKLPCTAWVIWEAFCNVNPYRCMFAMEWEMQWSAYWKERREAQYSRFELVSFCSY